MENDLLGRTIRLAHFHFEGSMLATARFQLPGFGKIYISVSDADLRSIWSVRTNRLTRFAPAIRWHLACRLLRWCISTMLRTFSLFLDQGLEVGVSGLV